jgi:hypothetical protein
VRGVEVQEIGDAEGGGSRRVSRLTLPEAISYALEAIETLRQIWKHICMNGQDVRCIATMHDGENKDVHKK